MPLPGPFVKSDLNVTSNRGAIRIQDPRKTGQRDPKTRVRTTTAQLQDGTRGFLKVIERIGEDGTVESRRTEFKPFRSEAALSDRLPTLDQREEFRGRIDAGEFFAVDENVIADTNSVLRRTAQQRAREQQRQFENQLDLPAAEGKRGGPQHLGGNADIPKDGPTFNADTDDASEAGGAALPTPEAELQIPVARWFDAAGNIQPIGASPQPEWKLNWNSDWERGTNI